MPMPELVPGPGIQDPDADAQDVFFGVRRTLSQEPSAVGLAFLIAHLDVFDDAEESGSRLPEAERNALFAGAVALFGDGGDDLGPMSAVPAAGRRARIGRRRQR